MSGHHLCFVKRLAVDINFVFSEDFFLKFDMGWIIQKLFAHYSTLLPHTQWTWDYSKVDVRACPTAAVITKLVHERKKTIPAVSLHPHHYMVDGKYRGRNGKLFQVQNVIINTPHKFYFKITLKIILSTILYFFHTIHGFPSLF